MSTRARSLVAACIGLLVLAVAASAQRSDDSVIVTASWLAQHVNDPTVVVLDVEHDPSIFAAGHIPGARLVWYNDLGVERDGNHLELPTVEQLRALFEQAGVSNGRRVVVYSSVAPMGSRAFFTLDYLGGVKASFLDGGLAAWKRANRPVSQAEPASRRGHYTPKPRPDAVVDAAWVEAHVGKPGVALIDTRTDGEYLGSGERHGMPSNGHVAGARQLQWEQLFANADEGTLLPRNELAALYNERTARGDTVVTYCYIGYRASMTYMVARALGYPTKLYDGSYEDWSRRKLPLVAGKSPK